ncbi:MAG: hypothetical protein ACU0B9_07120 [Limimaricola soesokkakensis]|uniref:hypothetical protein n=1 Tax=Limimaricola soesokkakensis TaxID=1343159 RepID=UPI0040586A7E
MTETILSLLTRLSEAGDDAILSGDLAKTFYGPIFDRLLAKRVIVEQAPLADWEVCDACECGLPCRPIQPAGKGFRADCPLDRRQDIVFTEDDLREFRIGTSVLARLIWGLTGLAHDPVLVAGKVWHLGVTPSGRTVVLALHVAALMADGLVAAIRQAAHFGAVTMLTPKLPADISQRFLDAGFHLVETLAVMTPASNGYGMVIDRTVLEPVPQAPALVVRTAMAEVQWLGRSVVLSRQLFPVFQRLLQKALSGDQVISGSQLEGTTGREAKDLIRELRAAFRAAGFTKAETMTLIVNVHNRGYHLDVPAEEIMIDG